MMSQTHSTLRFAGATLVGALILFVWGAVSPNFPWGLGVVESFSATSGEPYVFAAPDLVERAPGSFTTAAFESDIAGAGIATLATDHSFSWVISAPRDAYDPGRFFLFEAITQVAVALALCFALLQLRELGRLRIVTTICTVGAAACLASYGSMTNWWALPVGYSAGMSANLLLGWTGAALAMAAVLFRKGKASTRV